MLLEKHLLAEPVQHHGRETTLTFQRWAVRFLGVGAIYGMGPLPGCSVSIVRVVIAIATMASVRCS